MAQITDKKQITQREQDNWACLPALGAPQHGRTAPSWLILGDVTRKLLKALEIEGVADRIDNFVTGTSLTPKTWPSCDRVGNQHN